jgi:hypothetical protein
LVVFRLLTAQPGRASQLACIRFANNAAAEGTLDRRVAGSLFIRGADACHFSR